MSIEQELDIANRDRILAVLDEMYGTEKEGFPHEADWQLLCAIMLSAQSTDKQVEAVLPSLYERFPTLSDMAAASENLLLEAANLGLGAVWLGIAPVEERMNKILEIFNLESESLRPFNIISLGYPAEGFENKFVDKYDETRVHYETY